MKITYVILMSITQFVYIGIMLLSPIYITPGWYFWSVLFFILTIASSFSLSNRLSKWGNKE